MQTHYQDIYFNINGNSFHHPCKKYILKKWKRMVPYFTLWITWSEMWQLKSSIPIQKVTHVHTHPYLHARMHTHTHTLALIHFFCNHQNILTRQLCQLRKRKRNQTNHGYNSSQQLKTMWTTFNFLSKKECKHTKTSFKQFSKLC